MEIKRKPLQGVSNIIRFNLPYYLFATIAVITLFIIAVVFSIPVSNIASIIAWLALFTTVASLVVSIYVYDLSGLYKLSWLDDTDVKSSGSMVNINAGFDEFSGLLQHKYPAAQLAVWDFYNPEKHTEPSIQRARKYYGQYNGTLTVSTSSLPTSNASANAVFLMMAAHEIRDDDERILFFKELNRILVEDGRIIVTEHLRDTANFLAYNIGFMHFLSRSSWCNTFKEAGLIILNEIKITPFITTFVLTKNGIAS